MRAFRVGLFLLVGLFPGVLLAQLSPAANNNLGIDLSPQSPEANSEVTATVNDYSTSAFGATIHWYLNGSLVPTADNQRSFTFRTGDVGETTAVELELVTPDEAVLTAERRITPGRIDILMDADTFTPSFYQGAALPSVDSTAYFTAVVFAPEYVNPSDLVYTWRLNGKTVGGGATVGNNQVEITIPFTPNPKLMVVVSRRDGTSIGVKEFSIPVRKPMVLFYPVSILTDIKEEALASPYSSTDPDLTVRAQPYYLSNNTVLGGGTVSWSLDGSPLTGAGSSMYEMTLSRVFGIGLHELQFQVKDKDSIMQRVGGALKLSN